MKALVTGGAGFIGSNLVESLVSMSQYENVVVLDDFSAGKLENLVKVKSNPKLSVVRGSVCNLTLVKKLVAESDVTFHLAVQCLRICNQNFRLGNKVNAEGTFNICLAAKQHSKKIVYVSTSEVYGSANYIPMDENHPTRPQSIYGLTKLIGEQYVTLFNRYYGVRAVIIRPFNAYGPNHREDQYAAVISAFIRRLEAGQPPLIEGNGEQTRDLTYVTDTVNGIILLSQLSNGEILNIGYGKEARIIDLAKALMKIYQYKGTPLYVHPRPNDTYRLYANVNRAKCFGYSPKVSLEEGLRKFVAWWKKNEQKEKHLSN
jgi:UDP-glucose 4-epimerase